MHLRAGYLNIPAALANTITVSGYATSPPLTLDANGNVLINNILWGTSGPNGANIIWGVNNLTLNTVWGNNILWGSNILWGNNILWGSSVWSNNIVWEVNVSTADLSSTPIYGE